MIDDAVLIYRDFFVHENMIVFVPIFSSELLFYSNNVSFKRKLNNDSRKVERFTMIMFRSVISSSFMFMPLQGVNDFN